jgi:hypothetical protein
MRSELPRIEISSCIPWVGESSWRDKGRSLCFRLKSGMIVGMLYLTGNGHEATNCEKFPKNHGKSVTGRYKLLERVD